jgi:hypothetical protein
MWVVTSLDVKTCTAQDQAVLEQLLRNAWASGSESEWELHLPKRDSVTFLAFQHEQLLGMMTRFERSFHPFTTTLEFAIDPAADNGLRRTLENTLFEQITHDITDRIFRAQLLEHQFQEIQFLQRKQFLEMRRTWIPKVNVSSLPVHLFEDSLNDVLERGYSVRGLNELRHDPALMQQLTEVNREYYLATHQINPPRECTLDQWHKIAFGEDWLPQASFVALKNNQIAAFSSLCSSEAEDACDVAWFASTPAFSSDGLLLNQALKAKELEYARTHAIANLCFEFDSTDPQAMALLETLSLDRGLALITYQTGIPEI